MPVVGRRLGGIDAAEFCELRVLGSFRESHGAFAMDSMNALSAVFRLIEDSQPT